MQTVWIVYLEVLAYTDDAPSAARPGFINVIAAAPDPTSAEQKVRTCLESYEWQVLSVESVTQVDPGLLYGEGDLNDLVDDVLQHPEHVRLSTLHTYKVN